MNPRFSSTPGVQIAMTRFNEVVYDSSTETVQFGSGLVCDDVYNALAPYDRSVAGARVAGVGLEDICLVVVSMRCFDVFILVIILISKDTAGRRINSDLVLIRLSTMSS